MKIIKWASLPVLLIGAMFSSFAARYELLVDVVMELAHVVTPPPAETEVATAAKASADRKLPATASTLPLIGLLGLTALAESFAVRAAASRLQ
jgi:hypothetical protein